MLQPARGCTALVGGNNLTTVAIMLAARGVTLKVPLDLAVVGFDDFDRAEAFEPRLSTMVQPCQAIGRAAALTLKKRIDEPTAPPEIIRLCPTFAIGESCGASARMVTTVEDEAAFGSGQDAVRRPKATRPVALGRVPTRTRNCGRYAWPDTSRHRRRRSRPRVCRFRQAASEPRRY